MVFLYFVLVGGLLWFLAYIRVPLWMGTATVAAFLIILGKWGQAPLGFLVPVGFLFLPLAVFLNYPSLRRKYFTRALFSLFRANIPSMSPTEREALDAGTVWWDGDLFSGRPDWKKFLRIPTPRLTSEEDAFLKGPAEELCRMLDDWKITSELQDLPPEVWDFIKKKGFFGMIIPKKYGGLEFSALAHSQVVLKVASRSITAAVTVMVPNSLGPAELLHRYGTEKQKDHYLPRLAQGDEVPCFGLTGPEAGSDAASLPDTGVICKGEFQGKRDILGIRLNWEKRYITLGPVATILGLAFRLYDPDHFLGDQEDRGITLALIPANLPGVTIGSRHRALDSAFQVGPNWGKDVFVPLDCIIGGPERAGQGWRMLMECLAVGRSISLPALSTGTAKLACRTIGAYARIRKQFKLPIGRFEGVEEGLARMGGGTYLVDAARILTVGGVDEGQKPSVLSAVVKYYLTERARKIVNDAMDIQGGAAICMGPRNLLARIYESLPISITVEGSNILTRTMIIFGQGTVRCHPYLLKEMKALAEPNPHLAEKEFDKALMGHVGFSISNAARTLFLGLTCSGLCPAPGSPWTRPYFKKLTRMSAAFALMTDVSLLVLGGALKRKEKLSGRLADIFSHLYLASAVLKRFEDDGHPRDDLPLMRWACDDALHSIQEGFEGLLRNFPVPLLGKFLSFLIFPLGRPFPPPSDKLGHEAAELLLSLSETRDRLTGGIHIPAGSGEALGRLEEALLKVIEAEPVEKKIQQAIRAGIFKGRDGEGNLEEALKAGVIHEAEAAVVRQAEAARREVVRVDDFPSS